MEEYFKMSSSDVFLPSMRSVKGLNDFSKFKQLLIIAFIEKLIFFFFFFFFYYLFIYYYYYIYIIFFQFVVFFFFFFFSSPEHRLRVSYCHHPMSVVVRRQQLVC